MASGLSAVLTAARHIFVFRSEALETPSHPRVGFAHPRKPLGTRRCADAFNERVIQDERLLIAGQEIKSRGPRSERHIGAPRPGLAESKVRRCTGPHCSSPSTEGRTNASRYET